MAVAISITRARALSFLRTLGYKISEKKKTNEDLAEMLAKLDDSATGAEFDDEEDSELLDEILAANEGEEEINVIDDDDEESEESEEEMKEEKPSKKGKKTTAAEEKPSKKAKKTTATKEEKPSKKETKTRARSTTGVCYTILECLQKASKKNPTTKVAIHEKLVKKFPTRDPDGMRRTIAGFPSWIEEYYKVRLYNNDKGYWVE